MSHWADIKGGERIIKEEQTEFQFWENVEYSTNNKHQKEYIYHQMETQWLKGWMIMFTSAIHFSIKRWSELPRIILKDETGRMKYNADISERANKQWTLFHTARKHQSIDSLADK